MFTDAKRLQQIIKNLLSNAFKFTHHGQVSLTVEPADGGLEPGQRGAEPAPARCSRSRCRDTGIGIPPDKQQIIFEAFQQADGSTSRKYGGTGLGLAISRELSRLLGGEIRLVSRRPAAAARSRLYLPLDLHAAAAGPQGAADGRSRRRRRRRPTARAPPTAAPTRNGTPCPTPEPARSRRPTGRWSTRSATTATTSSRATACC